MSLVGAASRGNEDAVRVLIVSKADVNAEEEMPDHRYCIHSPTRVTKKNLSNHRSHDIYNFFSFL